MKHSSNRNRYRALMMSAAVLAVGTSVMLANSSVAYAQSTSTHSYDIPAGTLAQALRTVESVSGQRIRFEPEDVEGQSVPAFKGSYDTIQIVQALAGSTGLTMETAADGSIRVYVPTVIVRAKRSEAETGFTKSRADTSTRNNVDLHKQPQSVQVITSKALESQQATSVTDALQNISGLVVRESAQGGNSFGIRGFAQTSLLSDGASNPNAVSANVAGVDSIEVLKGPQAILSGNGSLGGGLNVVTKKPTTEKIRDLTVQYGSYGDKTVGLDLSGPFDDDRITYRLIASASQADENDAGFNGREAAYLLAQVRYKDSRADLTVGVSSDTQYIPTGRYTFGLDFTSGAPTEIRAVPKGRLGTADDGINLDMRRVSYSLNYKLASWATLVSNLSFSNAEVDLSSYGPSYPWAGKIYFSNSNTITNTETLSGDHYVRFNFTTGALEHRLSTGFNHTKSTSDSLGYSGGSTNGDPYNAPVVFPGLVRSDTTLSTIGDLGWQQNAFFIQDFVSWGKWHLSVNLRQTEYEAYDSNTRYVQWGFDWPTKGYKSKKTTGGVGVVYEVNPQISVYAAHSTGYLPQNTATRICGTTNSTDYPPMETENSEAGVKYRTRDGRFSLTSSLYQLNQTNVIAYNGSQNCNDIREAQKISGLELDGSGELRAGWSVLFNYTYADSSDPGTSDPNYKLPAMQPEHQGSLWTTYEFQSERLKGFGLSGGLQAVSSSRFGTGGILELPAYQKVDLSGFYKTRGLTVTLGIKNLFDETIYGPTASELYIPVLAGRTFMLTLKKGL